MSALRGSSVALIIGLVISPSLSAQSSVQAVALPDSALKVTYAAFVDGYYAYDFNRPPTFDRSFTTQAARHNEFNVNLAFVEAKLEARGLRGRLALQAGTSVQSNYAGEPRNGIVSGPELARFIQEAVVGVRVGSDVWIDGGIFFSHIGMEGFVSRDNLLYTRSLVADFSPYYESGVKGSWRVTPALSAQVAIVNGWQIISESNSAKSAGVRLDYAPSANATFSYYNYLGDEAPDTALQSRYRFYQGAGIKVGSATGPQLVAEFDYGTERRGSGRTRSSWHGGMLAGRYQATSVAVLVARVERYVDADQTIVATGTPDGLRASGASVGVDVAPQPRVQWRTEFRGLRDRHAVFMRRGNVPSAADAVIVSSLALTF